MIRTATVQDVPAMLAVYAPYVLNTCYTFEYEVPTAEEFTRRVTETMKQCPWLVWEEGGKVLGYAYGGQKFSRAAYRWCAEISIYLAPEVQGKGVGRQMYRLLEAILFAQGYRVIYAVITSDNPASIGFHGKLGYRVIAEFPGCGYKFGRELGTVWMEKRSNFSEIPTEFPIPWLSIVNNNGKLEKILDNFALS